MLFRKFVLPGLVVAVASAFLVASATAQNTLKNNDIAISGFAQFTSTATGNGITDKPSKSGGGAASFRHSYRWWLGYEAGYAYTRYSEFYSGQLFGYQHNMHDFSGAYYVHGVRAFGIEPFATAGVSALIFSPSLNGGQKVAWQSRPGLNFSAGINYPLATGHFGVRLQYRGVYYKAPDFGNAALATDHFRLTSEPMAGLYVRF